MLQLLSKKSVLSLFILISTIFQSPLWSMESSIDTKEPIPYHQRPGSEVKMNWQEGETAFYFPPCELIKETFEKRILDMKERGKEIGIDKSETEIYNPWQPTAHVLYNGVTYKCILVTTLHGIDVRGLSEKFSVTLDVFPSWKYHRIIGTYLIIGIFGENKRCRVFPLLDLTQFVRIALPVHDLEENYHFENGICGGGSSEFNNIGQHCFDVPLLFGDKLLSDKNYIKNLTLHRLILLKNAESSFWLPPELFHILYETINSIFFSNSPQEQFKKYDSYAHSVIIKYEDDDY